MGLHNGSLAIHVDYQAWEVIALTMNKTISSIREHPYQRGFFTNNTNRLAHLEGRTQSTLPKRIINLYVMEGENTDGNRTYLEMSYSNKFLVVR